MRWVVALFCVIGCSLPQEASAAGIIVNRDPGLSAHERADIRSDAGVTLDRPLPLPHVELVTAPDERAEQALATLNADPDVRFAVPDVPVRSAANPTDPRFPEQWAFDSGDDPDIDLPDAWDFAPAGGSGVTVGVADQLISVNHSDLNDNIDQRYHADPSAFDFTEPDGCTASTPLFGKDHGTHVAGTVAAERDNGAGGTGVAPSAKILPLRTLDNCGAGKLSWVLDAFAAAKANELGIVVASLATDPLMDPSERAGYNELIAGVFAANPGTLYVVAAGNEGNDNDVLPVYPCSTLKANGNKPENLVCVGMTRRYDDLPVCWGNVGNQSVDLFAPGTEILSTVGPNTYTRMVGTSMSAPIVAGVAALLASTHSATTAAELRERLLRGVDSYAGMADVSVSGGRLNALGVVSDVGPTAPRPGGAWATCDRDHDTVLDSSDNCSAVANPGQADADADGIGDVCDNCPSLSNSDQGDAEGDRVGDACDPTPRGDDPDGDTKGALDDRCPNEPSPAADGCPVVVVNPPQENPPAATPTPTPAPAVRIVSLGLTVTPNACPKRDPKCARTAKVTIKVSREAKVSVKVEKRVKKKARWVWQRVSSKSLTATVRGKSVTVHGKRGRAASRYRMTATLAGAAKAVSFRV